MTKRLQKCLCNQKGDMSFFSIIAVLVVNIIIAFVLLMASVQIHCINIRNGIKMELNNLSDAIYSDTYHSQREANLNEYLNTLYSSSAYTRQLEERVISSLQKKVSLEHDDYTIRNMSMEYTREPDSIKYIFRCEVEFYIRMFGTDFPAIVQQVTLTGHHNTKY